LPPVYDREYLKSTRFRKQNESGGDVARSQRPPHRPPSRKKKSKLGFAEGCFADHPS
jgi:hypothetical protein